MPSCSTNESTAPELAGDSTPCSSSRPTVHGTGACATHSSRDWPRAPPRGGDQMVNESLVAAKLVELTDRLERAGSRCPATAAQLAADRDALDLVAFNLMLAVQTCADIAAHVITDEGWPAAETLAAAFNRLVEHGVTRP